MNYKFRDMDIIYPTHVKIIGFPHLIEFIVGEGQLDSPTVSIFELIGNDYVKQYIVTDTPEPPALDDPRWSNTPPANYTFVVGV